MADGDADASPPVLAAMKKLLPRLALAAILIAAAALRLWRLDEGGVVIPYYLAGVRSMLQSWHNFFFNAFDPAGFVSLDKPPVAFWLQTASAALLGFNRFAVPLPQAIAGTAAVALLYWLVRRRFGIAAGLLAALFLALTPVSVAVDRSNNTESLLVLVLLLAAWAFFTGLESGRLRWLLASAFLVGIGFNTKMLVAFGVVPAFALAYLGWSGTPLSRRVGALAAAGGVLAVVSLSWCLVYDMTPTDRRPFVDSSTGNSMLELVVGHNFAERFVRPARTGTAATAVAPDLNAVQPPYRDYAPAGPLRLAAPPLAAQFGWLFLLTVGGAIIGWRREPAARATLAVWIGWALVYGIVFSAAGGLFHAYYLAVMAPAIAVLAAIGTIELWQLSARGRRGALALAAAIVLTVLWQAHIVHFYLTGSLRLERIWLLPLLAAAILAAVGLAVARSPPARRCAAAAGFALLLTPPAAWSIATAVTEGHAGFPTARPPFLNALAEDRRGRFNEVAGAMVGDPKLIAFLEQNRAAAAFLMAAVNARLAAPLIIATGLPVMALGGFNGQAPILAPADFARLVAANQVRFALIGDGSPGLRRVFGEGGQQALTDWIRANGRPIDPALWRSTGAAAAAMRSAESVGAELWDLRPSPSAAGS
jgi:4-amino-4-deoxy-L-arabinose transferase-like glycosyltransferase